MNKQNLEMLRVGVTRTDQWLTVLSVVNDASVKMGTFENPLEDDLKSLTYEQWQLENARRATLAVLDFLIARSPDE